jgi:hypothetical protein
LACRLHNYREIMKTYRSARIIVPLITLLTAVSAAARPIKIPPPDAVALVNLTSLWDTITAWLSAF